MNYAELSPPEKKIVDGLGDRPPLLTDPVGARAPQPPRPGDEQATHPSPLASPDSLPKISADFVADLVLGRVIAADGRPVAVLPWGLQLSNLQITGKLNLADAAGEGTETLPPLVLERCWFDNPITLDGARFARVSFSGSRFSRLSADRCRVDGDFKVDGVSTSQIEPSGYSGVADGDAPGDDGAPPKGPECSLSLKGARIGGELWLRASAFVAEAMDPEDQRDIWVPRKHAVDLTTARVVGDIVAIDLKALGGLKMRGAKIEGDVWMYGGARIEAANRAWAIDGRGASVSGGFTAWNIEATGGESEGNCCLSFVEAHFGGTVNLSGAICSTDGAGAALDLRNATFGHDFNCIGVIGDGSVALEGSRIGGRLNLDLVNLSVSGKDMDIQGAARISGRINSADLERARINGSAELGPLILTPPVAFGGRSSVISLRDATVKGAIQIGKIELTDWTYARRTAATFYPGWAIVELISQHQGQRSWRARAVLWDGKNEIVDLDGASSSIHALNERGQLKIDSDPRLAAYLRFFCAMIWGDRGAFPIQEGDIQYLAGDNAATVNGKIEREAVAPGGRKWPAQIKASAVRYGNDIFNAVFDVSESGEVVMAADRQLGPGVDLPEIDYKSPDRIFAGLEASDIPLPFSSDWKWCAKGAGDTQKFKAAWKSFCGARVVNLAGLSCSALIDGDGDNWDGDLEFELEEISVSRFASARDDDRDLHATAPKRQVANGQAPQLVVSPEEFNNLSSKKKHARRPGAEKRPPDARRRLWWLGRHVGEAGEWSSQPLSVFARGYRGQGYIRQSITLLKDKAKREFEKFVAPIADVALRFSPVGWAWFWWGLALVCAASIGVFPNSFGLPSWAALIVAAGPLLFWAAIKVVGHVAWGWGFGWGLEPINALVLCVLYVVGGVGGVEIANANDVLVQAQGSTVGAPCGTSIVPALYAVETFIPLLDLGEEGLCTILPSEIPWRWAKALYVAFGWLIFSLAALTWTGPMRRRTDL